METKPTAKKVTAKNDESKLPDSMVNAEIRHIIKESKVVTKKLPGGGTRQATEINYVLGDVKKTTVMPKDISIFNSFNEQKENSLLICIPKLTPKSDFDKSFLDGVNEFLIG